MALTSSKLPRSQAAEPARHETASIRRTHIPGAQPGYWYALNGTPPEG